MLKSEAKKRLLARRTDLCLNGVKEEVESALSIGRRSLVLNLDIGANSKASQKVIREVEVIVWKADRGVAGSKIFVSNRTAATQALSAKFLGSVYLQSKNAAGENNQKAKLIQEQFVSNLDVVKKLRERMVQYDTKTPFMIPQGYSDTVSINGWEDRWDLSGEIIDLTINWGKLTLDHCCKWRGQGVVLRRRAGRPDEGGGIEGRRVAEGCVGLGLGEQRGHAGECHGTGTPMC